MGPNPNEVHLASKACSETFRLLISKGFSELWTGLENRKKLLSGLLYLGTNHLLHSGQSLLRLKMATSIALTIALLAENDNWPAHYPGVTLLVSSIRHGDTTRETARFFAKRSACSCLKEKYALMKQERGRRYGICFACYKKVELRELLVCTACRQVQYCSKECQKNDWPRHRTNLCTLLQSSDDYAMQLLHC